MKNQLIELLSVAVFTLIFIFLAFIANTKLEVL